MFFRKKEKQKKYDPSSQKPVIRASICTGEKVAGFIDLHNHSFMEVMLIRNHKDLEEFRNAYGITEEIETVY